MRRDMDLIRKLAIAIEDNPDPYPNNPIEIEGYSAVDIGYNLYQMFQAGLIEGQKATTLDGKGPYVITRGLTWAGHEFVDNARNDNLWNKTKTLVKDKTGSVSIAVFIEVLKKTIVSAF